LQSGGGALAAQVQVQAAAAAQRTKMFWMYDWAGTWQLEF